MTKFSPYTDLALEIAENISSDFTNIDGVKMAQKEYEDINTSVTVVDIINEMGAEKMQKPIGKYITIESGEIKENNREVHEKIIAILSRCIDRLCSHNQSSTILVVGLGNSKVTPDALGPKVVDRVLVTRHIRDTISEDIADDVCSVSAISPGVMGVTGIETFEIVKGIAEKIHPDLIIAIDALAARNVSRINSTIQLTNTGVAPGAGVGNKRKTIDFDSMGVPVVAIGVPTVVDAATLANDTIDRLLSAVLPEMDKESPLYKPLCSLANDDKYELITEILSPYSENMFVTPKEVDAVIENLTNIIANGINIALHRGINFEDIGKYK